MSDPLTSSDSFEGISEEDRREIMVEIDRVAGENRIQVTDEIFSYTPQSRGVVFPLVVNILGAVILVGGILGLGAMFRSSSEELKAGGARVVTAESRLIEEIRREADELLAKKEDEIAAIQSQLASIQDERTALAADIQERFARREAELQQQFEAELAAERQRLIGLNLSETEIEARLAEFSAVKEREYAQRLEQFQRQVQAEQRRLEAELDTLEGQFNRTLQTANLEREQLKAESEARLAAMQAEFQAELAAGQAELTAAEAELARLTEEQQRAELVRNQINGLFQATNEALGSNSLDEARGYLRDLRSLLNAESSLRIPELRAQRPVNLFIVEALERLVSFQERFGNPETLQRLSDASMVQEVTVLAEEAAAAAAAGDQDQAAALYRRVINVIPAVGESVAYLGGVDGSGEVATEEINRAAAEQIATADRAAEAGEWSQALEAYVQAVQRYPQSRYRGQAVAGIRRAGEVLTDRLQAQEATQDETVAALEAQITVLERERAATQTALSEAQSANTRLEAELAQRQQRLAALESGTSSAAGTTAALESQITTLEERIERQNSRIAELNRTIQARDQKLNDTETELVAALENLAQARTETVQAAAVSSSLRDEISVLKEQLRAGGIAETADELVRLRALEEEVEAAQQQYRNYMSTASDMAIGGGDATSPGVLEARTALERFLRNQAVSQLFPDIADEIARYDDAFLASGRQNAYLTVADILTELSFLQTASERAAFLKDTRRDLEREGGAAAAEFIGELEALLGEGDIAG